jgi:hypothetical protein
VTETRTIHDPFLSKDVSISDGLVDRLRGKYAVGPTLPGGQPEFGWRQMETSPISHEAADEIERLRDELINLKAQADIDRLNHALWMTEARNVLKPFRGWLDDRNGLLAQAAQAAATFLNKTGGPDA